MKKLIEEVEPYVAPLAYIFAFLFFWEIWISLLALLESLGGHEDPQFWLELSPFYHVSKLF